MSRILVVDDDEQLGRSIGRIVQREGHEYRTAENLHAAVENLAAYIPDLVIVELQPEWVSDLGPFRARLDQAAGRRTPLIFTIGRRELFRPIGALATPGDDWTGKPIDPAEFAIRVARSLQRCETNG